MRILEAKAIQDINHGRVMFIRVQPLNLRATLTIIINTLSDLSWINTFDEEYIRDAYLSRAQPTVTEIVNKLTACSDDAVSSDAGEYVVSELSRSAIIKQMKYLDIPLAELYSKQILGNPGFDFHTQNDCECLIFGEAKYLTRENAYGVGLKQVVTFINEEKDKKDIPDLRDFCCSRSLDNAMKGIKGFAVGFSAKSTNSETLIKNILSNDHFKKLLVYQEIILVAVNI